MDLYWRIPPTVASYTVLMRQLSKNCKQAAGRGHPSRNRVEDLYSYSQEVTCRDNPFRSLVSSRCTLSDTDKSF